MNAIEVATYKVSKYNLSIESGGVYFLYNTATGACMRLEKSAYNALHMFFNELESEGQISDEYAKVEKFLAENGFIVSGESNEYRNAVLDFDARNNVSTDLKLVLVPSLRCNMNCYYCYETAKNSKSYEEKDFAAIVNFVEEKLPVKGKLEITWFGGEPLLMKESIYNLSEWLIEICNKKDADFSAIIVSNCYFLDTETAVRLKKYNVKSVQVTLDGDRERHDSIKRSIDPVTLTHHNTFDQIITNLKNAAEILDISLRINVNKLNVKNIVSLLETLKSEGLHKKLKNLYFAPVFDVSGIKSSKYNFDSKEFAEVEAILIQKAFTFGFRLNSPFTTRKKGCHAIYKNGYVIDPSGEIKKCDHQIGMAQTSFSNIHDQHTIDTKNLDKWEKYKITDFEPCKSCRFFPMCYTGCANGVMKTNQQQCITLKFNWEKIMKFYIAQFYSERN